MEKATNFLINPIFKDLSLLNELVSRVTFSENEPQRESGEWFNLIIGSNRMDDELVGVNQPGQVVTCIFSNWLLVKTVHEFIELRIRLKTRVEKLEAEVKARNRLRQKANHPNKKTRNNFNRRRRRKAQAHRMKASA